MRKNPGVLKVNMKGISVDVRNLTKKFGNFTAVNNISFKIKKGEIFGFLGPNGAGKTTTIRMLCGLMDSTEGEAYVGGYDINNQSEDIKKIIGYMSQKFSLYDDLTVSENIDFFAGIYQTKKEDRSAKKKEIIAISELVGMENTLTGNLASSTKQHLALGCALINDPQIIFLDEPTAGVDPVARKKFWETIKMLSNKGVTILVTTHYMDEAENCDRIALISDGIMIACDSPEGLKKNMMKGRLIEIDCSDVIKALELLKDSASFHEVSMYGIKLRLVIESESDIDEMKKLLESENIKVNKVMNSLPTLEDVFVSLVEEQQKKRPVK